MGKPDDKLGVLASPADKSFVKTVVTKGVVAPERHIATANALQRSASASNQPRHKPRTDRILAVPDSPTKGPETATTILQDVFRSFRPNENATSLNPSSFSGGSLMIFAKVPLQQNVAVHNNKIFAVGGCDPAISGRCRPKPFIRLPNMNQGDGRLFAICPHQFRRVFS